MVKMNNVELKLTQLVNQLHCLGIQHDDFVGCCKKPKKNECIEKLVVK